MWNHARDLKARRDRGVYDAGSLGVGINIKPIGRCTMSHCECMTITVEEFVRLKIGIGQHGKKRGVELITRQEDPRRRAGSRYAQLRLEEPSLIFPLRSERQLRVHEEQAHCACLAKRSYDPFQSYSP